MVYQLIYTSSGTAALDDFALREIAHSSSYRNQELGITGLLMFHEGSIMQILEGDQMSVQSLYNKLKRDIRHTGCIILSERMGEEREFSNWFMGYKNISGHKHADALFSLNQNSLSNILPQTPSEELDILTKTYAKTSGL